MKNCKGGTCAVNELHDKIKKKFYLSEGTDGLPQSSDVLKIDLKDSDIAKLIDDLESRSFIEKDEDLDVYEYKHPEVE